MNKFWLLLLAVFFTFGLQAQERIPDRFINHKVKKKETLYSLSQKYGVTVDQIEAYNPTLIKSRLKRKMTLRIPV